MEVCFRPKRFRASKVEDPEGFPFPFQLAGAWVAVRAADLETGVESCSVLPGTGTVSSESSVSEPRFVVSREGKPRW